MTPTMLEAALDYAGRGWPVLPVYEPVGADQCACGTSKCSQAGKHPRTVRGLHDASIDAEQIRRWWETWPNANIGLRTGVAFDVLDIDHVDMVEATAPLEQFTITAPTVRTGKNGWHLYVEPTGLGNATKIGGLALDWRGRNGYVIAPPSLHANGRRYEWVTVDTVELHPCPDVLHQFVATRGGQLKNGNGALPGLSLAGTNPSRSDDSLAKILRRRVDLDSLLSRTGAWSDDGLISQMERATEGTRNGTLNWAAWKIGHDERSGRCDAAQAATALRRLASAAAQAGLPEVEVNGKTGGNGSLQSGYRAGLAGRGAPR